MVVCVCFKVQQRYLSWDSAEINCSFKLCFSFVLLMMRIVHAMGGHGLLDILKKRKKSLNEVKLKQKIKKFNEILLH